jgi:hypothetical protein
MLAPVTHQGHSQLTPPDFTGDDITSSRARPFHGD